MAEVTDAVVDEVIGEVVAVARARTDAKRWMIAMLTTPSSDKMTNDNNHILIPPISTT